MIDRLDVMLWGIKAGTLVSLPKGYSKQICFYFNPDFIRSGYDIAPLRASITGAVAQRGLPVYPDSDRIFGGLPSFIADSLPDHWGNILFREWTRSHDIQSKDLSPLDMLAYIGRRGMGALEFVPPTSIELETPFKVEISELSSLSQRALKEARDIHAKLSPGLHIENLFKVGTSAGGRRPKAVINVNTETGEFYSGQVVAPKPGFTPMIIKFDEHSNVPTTKIEYSYYLMAVEAGMNIMPSMVIEGNDETHFLTERFDRDGNEKIHVQTLAAINPLATSYENLFETALNIDIDQVEICSLFLQMTMNVLGGNIDDHNKNFSFLMNRDGKWHAAPAYDYTFAIDTSAPDYVNRHILSINGKTQHITGDDMIIIARAYNVKSPRSIINKAIDVVSEYRRFALRAGVGEEWISKIESEIGSRIGEMRQ